MVFLACVAACSQSPAADISLDLFYTQYGYQLSIPSAGKVHAQFSFGAGALTLTGNTVLISKATNAAFNGADGIVVNRNNGNLLIGGGGLGTTTVQGKVFQITPNGTIPAPFSVSPDGAGALKDPRAYGLVIVPANGGRSGFPAGTLLALPKDFGVADIAILPLAPSLGDGKAYPVTGDD